MDNEELNWRQTLPAKSIYSKEVHVWRVLPDLTSIEIENLREILSVDELRRTNRFHFERDKKRFIASRGILRKILGHYLGNDPREIRFEYTQHGKPMLASKSECDTISFNLSHSDAFIVYAVTLGQHIGIDLERIRDNVEIDLITESFFSQGEISALKQIHKNKWAGIFFQYWTRKEALLKAMGKGISFPMEQCDVSLLDGKTLSRIILPPGNDQMSSSWYVKDLCPRNGYAAALAVEKADSDISYWQYSL